MSKFIRLRNTAWEGVMVEDEIYRDLKKYKWYKGVYGNGESLIIRTMRSPCTGHKMVVTMQDEISMIRKQRHMALVN